MIELKTRLRRTIHGHLVMETTVPLEGDFVLMIYTSKIKLARYLETHAVVGQQGDGYTTTQIFHDYNKTLAKEPVRATEKAIRTQHEQVLATIDTILADVTRHYAGEPALLA